VTGPALDVSDLSVWRGGRRVLDRVDLALRTGSFTAVIGPNGAGKSTLLGAIAGLVRYTGDVRIDGRPVRALRRRERAKELAVVPQVAVVPDEMPVLDYVLLGRTPHIAYWSHETDADIEVARTALDALDALHLSDRLLGEVSGGERQRVLLARAVAQEAPLLLLDEPTTHLDIGHQVGVLDVAERLRADHGRTLLVALHDLTLAGQYADTIVLLDAGRVVATGSPAEVLAEPVLAARFGATLAVLTDPAGRPVVVPQRR
jgi:iron complex transport system ATP-binding protein